MNRATRLLLAVIVTILLAALLPSAAHAQEAADGDDDVLIRVNGNVTIEDGESIDQLVVIDANATIDGTVRDNVLVISGNATVNGTIGGSLTVIDGNIDLRDGSTVNDVNSFSGDLTRAPGATVTGNIEDRDNFEVSGLGLALFSIWFWLATTLILVVAALLFAAVGGRQLTRVAMSMTSQIVNCVVAGVFLWIALPLLAVLIMLTLVGILLGIAVFVFFLPAVWFLGYIAAGTRLGMAITSRMGRQPGERPLLAAALGVIVLQLIILIPFVGWIVGVLAGLWGSSALAYTAFAAAGGKSFESTPPSTAPSTA